MSNLKQLRLRIRGISATKKVTKAMQLVAASKLKKARSCIHDAELYNDAIVDILQTFASSYDLLNMDSIGKSFFAEESEKPTLLVVFSSERGLCGALNANIVKHVKLKIKNLLNQNKAYKLIIVGKKAYDALKGAYADDIEMYVNCTKDNREFILYKLKQKIFDMVSLSQVGECLLYFNKFYSAMSYKVTENLLSPISKPIATASSEYEFEGEHCLEYIINLYINSTLNHALVHSMASEEGSRMVAMDSATKNANKMVNELTLKLNRTRQGMITKELVEIISSAESI